ncbi:reverse transcriptase/maturase family protein [Paenibacillus sp. FSL W8-1187]|uniref:reverse transcriptase/maturase family protein n=1 Tax=Paenibacillus sp. FSL W8-1187 TaxID=2975339 RepID=UPI0030D9C077
MSISELFSRKFQLEHLRNVYNSKISHKANLGLDRMNRNAFEKNLDDHLNLINYKIYNRTYKFTYFKEKLLSKGKGKLPRVISIPTIRDKITLSVLNELLTEVYKNEIEGKLTHTIIDEIKNAVNSGEYNYFIKIDIKNFYDNINHQIILRKIKKKIKDKSILSLVEKALTNPTVSEGKRNAEPEVPSVGVPQGVSISNILANIYLLEVDKRISNFKGVKYFRYVDDILILCTTSNKKRTLKSIENELCNKLKLAINSKKDEGLLTVGFDYLGYAYKKLNEYKYGFSVKSNNLLKLETSIIEIFSEYKRTKSSEQFLWDVNNRITGFVLEDSKYGWLFFYSQIDNVAILYHLDWFVNKMCIVYKVNPALQKQIKRFVKAFFEIIMRRGKSAYIPNSKQFPLDEKKRILQTIYNINKSELDKISDEEVDILFKRKVYISVKELEKDVQNIS